MTKTVQKYDVVVVGAGAGGIAAAVGAARTGARTLLVERYGFMGGAATNAQVLAYCGFFARGETARQTVLGVGQDLLLELKRLGVDIAPIVSKSGYWIIMLDPEAAKLGFDRLARGSAVDVRLHTRLIDAEVEGDRIRSVTLVDHSGMTIVEAGAFVDASGEATLSTLAGVPLSQEGGANAHLQAASFPIRIGGVPDAVVFDRTIMAGLIAEHNKTAETPILRDDGGVVSRLPLSNDMWWMAIDLETDGITGESLTDVEFKARELAWRNLGVLRRHPGFEKAYLVSTGPQMGIRETRRPFSRADVVEQDIVEGRRHEDGIARASWPMEVHEAPGKARFLDIGGEGFFDVRAGAVEAAKIVNLRLGGRVIGADPKAYGSIRVMGTAFATGHAAGVSAALAAEGIEADVARLRKTLEGQGAVV
ncbi:FAD-dependent oxidoreductase [Aquamicrobium sp. LC103]|uniref:FAD-dependent oxidoreductase n=1 Tax=Aquamicrobium sp. LC103 TaxID=1120658 RepID=UPI00063E7E98|nr:FAD-dependent oxidoreductase [Aquamicrobium sp. LC103]TKT75867.1 FAD-dependent oxidoreductase [Aquamicrobium sp. LC103]